ncbi:DUF4252 domain-containing protein [Flavobacterium sp.]|uniref:DUF4252 domain-containing protein n=1 Tax=Flavobacterium sp. TaxID=239 RepID=UPI0038FC00A6
MKKQILTLVVVLITNSIFAQVAFDKFEGQDDISSIIVNKKMFDLMSKVKLDTSDKEIVNYLNLVQKLDNLKVFTTTSVRATTEMKVVSEKYSLASGLEELMRVNEEGKNIKLMVKAGASTGKIKELLMFIEGGGKDNETVLMSLTGDFDLDQISLLTDKLKIPGSIDLKKAMKNKK